MITQRQLLEHAQRAWALIDTQEKWASMDSLAALSRTGPNEQSYRIVQEVQLRTGQHISTWENTQRRSYTAAKAFGAVAQLWAMMIATYEFGAMAEEQGQTT